MPIEYEITDFSENPNKEVYTRIPIEDIEYPSSPCRICLNMIVKNESKVILRLLKSVKPLIDTYCICDTGSTDNTVEIIQTFFDEEGIEGQIIYEGFKDFGYNRTFALNACDQIENIDYVLLLDADMFLTGSALETPAKIQELKERLRTEDFDAIHLLQGSDTHYHKNVRIVKPRRGCTYWGVTHEYVKTPEGTKYSEIEKTTLFIRDIGDGGSKTDKFERDIRLLEKGLEDHPGNDRYTFYLANSYRDAGRIKMAIDTYKKRIKIGGWVEEVWDSYYNLGKCYKYIGDIANAIYYWAEGFQFHPVRLEAPYEIAQYYRIAGKTRLAYMWITSALLQREKTALTTDHLFLQREVYDYKLDYELSIIGYYVNDAGHDLAKVSMKVLAYPFVPEDIARNVMSNYKFYASSLTNRAIEREDNLYYILNAIVLHDEDNDDDQYVASTPSITYNTSTDTLAVIRRYVNYKIDENGGYVNRDKIRTKNVVGILQKQKGTPDRNAKVWSIKKAYIMPYDESKDNVYVGLEDVRIISTGDKIMYSANRGLDHSKIAVEYGVLGGKSAILRDESNKSIEKNWVILPSFDCGSDNPIDDSIDKMVYGWSPLVIGQVENDAFIRLHTEETPSFFKHLRGSTNGIVIGDEIWFIGHLVSYEDRRFYYHMFVVLDCATLRLKKYSKLFTFEGGKVEYTLGFIVDPIDDSRFIIGYSVMDSSTKYLTVGKDAVLELF
jgi:tetratricopeptide (TPR) repeat protein